MPGARWFRVDLHVHTLDDHPGGRVRWGGRSGEPIDDRLLTEYARAVLKTAVARGVEVLGLTPHAVYCQGQETLSAVWRIVETWNAESQVIPWELGELKLPTARVAANRIVKQLEAKVYVSAHRAYPGVLLFSRQPITARAKHE